MIKYASNSHGFAVWHTPDKISLQGFFKSWQLWNWFVNMGYTNKISLIDDCLIIWRHPLLRLALNRLIRPGCMSLESWGPIWNLSWCLRVTATSCSFECDILGLPIQNFITSGKIHFESVINWLDFSGQRSRSQGHLIIWYLKTAWGNLFKFWSVVTRTQS